MRTLLVEHDAYARVHIVTDYSLHPSYPSTTLNSFVAPLPVYHPNLKPNTTLSVNYVYFRIPNPMETDRLRLLQQRVVPDQEEAPSLTNSNGGAGCPRLRCMIPDNLVKNWLADHKVTHWPRFVHRRDRPSPCPSISPRIPYPIFVFFAAVCLRKSCALPPHAEYKYNFKPADGVDSLVRSCRKRHASVFDAE